MRSIVDCVGRLASVICARIYTNRFSIQPRRLAHIAVVVFLLMGSTCAKAQGIGYPAATTCPTGPAPTLGTGDTSVMPGRWGNPNRYGTGWDLIYTSDHKSLLVYWYTFQSGNPVWLVSDLAVVDNVNHRWTANLNYVQWQQSVNGGQGGKTQQAVGSVSIQFSTSVATRAAIRWVWPAVSGTQTPPDECIYNTFSDTAPSGTLATIPTTPTVDASYSGAWDDPNHGGWGVAEAVGQVQTTGNPYVEVQTLLTFDVAGLPTWLQAQNGPNPLSPGAPPTTSVTTPLLYYQATYAVNNPAGCNTSACRVSTTAGSSTRSFASTTAMTYSASATVLPTVTGSNEIDWPNPHLTFENGAIPPVSSAEPDPSPLGKILGNNYLFVSQTYCSLQAGQTSCPVTAAWNYLNPSGNPDTTALVYEHDDIANAFVVPSLYNGTSCAASPTLAVSPNYVGSSAVCLAPNAKVHFELHSGGLPTGTVLLTSAQVQVSAAPPPAAPTGVTVPASTNVAGFNVTWNAVTGATYYKLQYSTNPTAGYSLINGNIPPTQTSYHVTLIASNTYYFQVQACNAVGCSAFAPTNGAAVVVNLPARAPTEVTAQATPGVTNGVTVKWAPRFGDEATYYVVNHATSVTGPFTQVGANVTAPTATLAIVESSPGTTYYYEVQACKPAPAGCSVFTRGKNFALAANGGAATATSSYVTGLYPPAAMNDGDRTGFNWGNGAGSGGWNDNTNHDFTNDVATINFSTAQTIQLIAVSTLQDAYLQYIDPSDAMTFSLYGLTSFEIQTKSSSGVWTTIPGVGTVTGNNLVKKTITFPAMTVNGVQVIVHDSADHQFSRIIEIEAVNPASVLVGSAPPAQAALFVSQSVPGTMVAGQSYPVSITMQNVGSATWTTATNYKLGSLNPLDNGTFGLARVPLPSGASIGTGQNVTFNFTATAPATAGTYNFQWQMLQEGVARFNQTTPNISVQVNASSSGSTPTSDPSASTGALPATINSSDAVGTTAAQFRVDEGGNATYSIPIQVPPGTAGVTPKLALSYNSRLPTGVMGPGWTIEGASQIARCRQSRESGDFIGANGAIDGNPAPVDFTTDDRFCLDGVRLLALGGAAYGAVSTTYSPENDPTVLVSAAITTAAIGPDSFTVKRKDGTTSTYGNTTASTNALMAAKPAGTGVSTNIGWNLSRVQDSSGNYIDYLYNAWSQGSDNFTFIAGQTDIVQATLSQVQYTGNAGQSVTPYAKIQFGYTTLPASSANAHVAYQSGVRFLQTQQLKTVTVVDGITTLRYYGLSYGTSTSGSSYQQLQSVQECRDSGKVVCFPATTFTWSGAKSTFQNDSGQTQTWTGLSNFQNASFKIADVDGDGRQDFVWAVNDGQCTVNGVATSSIYVGFLDVNASGYMTITTGASGTQAKTCAPIDLTNKDQAWYLLDYDGDGRADLLIGGGAGSAWQVLKSHGRTTSGAAVFSGDLLLAQGISIVSPACFYSVYDGTNVCNSASAVMGDFNGDGLPDLLLRENSADDPDGKLTVRFLQQKTDGTGALQFSAAYNLTYSITDTNCSSFIPAQSPVCDIALFNFDKTRHRSVTVTDINGDGRTDLTAMVQVTTSSQSNVLVHGDTARSYWAQFSITQITPPNGATAGTVALAETWADTNLQLPSDSSYVFVADLNGDGLPDILYLDPNSTASPPAYWVMINNGSGYNPRISVTGGIPNGNKLQLADINGDGITDIVYPVGDDTNDTNLTYSYISLAVGASGYTFTTAQAVPGGGMHDTGHWASILGDLDGDGAADFLGVKYTDTSGAILYTSRSANGNRYQPRDVVTDFVNGFGATTHIAYQPLTNKGVYQWCASTTCVRAVNQTAPGYGSPMFDVVAPMYVVSQATSSAPVQGAPTASSSIYYRYAGAKLQAGGRGFLGFAQTWAYDTADLTFNQTKYIATVNNYAQNFPFIGMPISTTKEVFDGGNGSWTRGNAGVAGDLDACAANPEASGFNCFAAIGSPGWSDQTSLGTIVSLSKAEPFCNGAGCTAPSGSSPPCANKLTSAPATTATLAVTTATFSAPTSPTPIFAFASQSSDAQYDLGTSAAIAQSDTYSCYPDSFANLTSSNTVTSTGTGTIVAQKIIANTYTNDQSYWYLGRLTDSQVTFIRGANQKTRTSHYVYAMGTATGAQGPLNTGLLITEEIQKNVSANEDLRTMYILDGFGNRTDAFQCSNDLTDTQCLSTTSTAQQQAGTQVHRFAHTDYTSTGTNKGRYTTDSKMPFYATTGTNNINMVAAVTTNSRDEFGNASQQTSANGLVQIAKFGTLGRPYYAADNSGKASTTTFGMCGVGVVTCPTDATFRSQTVNVTAGTEFAPSSWAYFDLLGRPILKIKEGFDGAHQPTAQRLIGECIYMDPHNRAAFQSEPFFISATAASDGSPSLSGNICAATAATSYATTTNYDVLGRPLKVTAPDGTYVTNSYTGLNTFTTNQRASTWEVDKNALGETVTTIDPTDSHNISGTGMTVTTAYDASGNVSSVSRDAGNGAIVTSFTYDELGRKTKQVDPDAGPLGYLYTYNAAGDVITQTDPKSQTVTQRYDALGRRYYRYASGGTANITDNWTYDTQANGYGQLASESRPAFGTQQPYSRSFTYDTFGRLYQQTTSINVTSSYTETTAYDAYGRVKARQDASTYSLTPHYTAHGFVDYHTDNRTAVRTYEALMMTARAQVSTDQRGGTAAMTTANSYNANNGRLYQVCSGNGASLSTGSCVTTGNFLQNLAFAFDDAGNLKARSHVVSSQTLVEFFAYDVLNRLTTVSVPTPGTVGSTLSTTAAMTLSYDRLGNVCSKVQGTNTQTYTYAGPAGCTNHGAAGSPHAVTSITGNFSAVYGYDLDGNQSTGGGGRTLSYDPLNELTQASNSSDGAQFQYADHGGRFQRVDNNGTRTTYVGSVEIIVSAGGATETRRYLAGVAIDYVRSSGVNETRYVFTDHLGSTDVVATSAGAVYESTSFDAHGQRRNASDWSTSQSTGLASTTHGFTDHEQLDSLGLIHMNGRIYDPQLGRMLQTDPMTGPSSQGLNRYSYVANNPLTLTDPSGYSWWGDLIHAVLDVVAGAYFGPVGVGILDAVWAYAQTGSASAAFTAGITGYVTATASFAINGGGGPGDFSADPGRYILTKTARAIETGLVQGTLAYLQGHNFGSAFRSAAFSSLFAPSGPGAGPTQYIEAFVVGGTASKLAGGNFANGARTAVFQLMAESAVESYQTRQARQQQLPAQQSYLVLAVNLNFASYDSNEPIGIWANAVPAQDGIFILSGHGSPSSMSLGGMYGPQLTVDQVANQIVAAQDYHGQDILLLSCNTGVSPDGSLPSFAENLVGALLARGYNVSVTAPNNFLWLSSDGTYVVAPPVSPPNAAWYTALSPGAIPDISHIGGWNRFHAPVPAPSFIQRDSP